MLRPLTRRADPKTGERTEKQHPIRTVTFDEGTPSETTVDIWTIGGRLHQIDHDENGTEIPIPLRRIENPIRRNQNGDHRHYLTCEVAHPTGGKPIRITERTYTRPDDTFNRPENIRQFPSGDPDYERIRGLRSDIEASNRVIDDHLHLRRARSIGAQAQLFDLLCHGLAENSVARHRHRLRPAKPHQAAGTEHTHAAPPGSRTPHRQATTTPDHQKALVLAPSRPSTTLNHGPTNRHAVSRRRSSPRSPHPPAPVAQGIEQWFPKPCAAGSNPAGALP